jgi:hypothetical protein
MYEYVAAVPFDDVLRLMRPFPIWVGHGLAGSRLVRMYDESWAGRGAVHTMATASATRILPTATVRVSRIELSFASFI